MSRTKDRLRWAAERAVDLLKGAKKRHLHQLRPEMRRYAQLLVAEEEAADTLGATLGLDREQIRDLGDWMDARAARWRQGRELKKSLHDLRVQDDLDEVMNDHYRYGSGD